MFNKLIIFCRYPLPGLAKTRLIPGVGAEKAAQIHKELAEFTLKIVQSFALKKDISIEVSFMGDDLKLMKSWLGDHLNYSTQTKEDLGLNMLDAFNRSFEQNYQKVVIIGTDCPEISSSTLEIAFSSLEDHDLVVGPAYDGGYYLIGLSKEIPGLFSNITWGSESVFDETMKHCTKDNIGYHLLEKLHDIDRPEDLPIWNQIKK
ncbi:MAG: glycosyltransferase [Proteobacteria bacterium]|nr:glycosyltransferase [Pseudomonadota bacterium]